MCIEFVIQVLKQKNAHVSFPVEMVINKKRLRIAHLTGYLRWIRRRQGSWKKREGVPEMGTKPLKALRDLGPLIEALRGSNRRSWGSRKTPKALRGWGPCSDTPFPFLVAQRWYESTRNRNLAYKKKHQTTKHILYFARSPENFVIFSTICLGFLHWKMGDFWWIFSGLHLPRNEARKLLEQFGENSEQNSGQNSGWKSEKFGEISLCNFSDPTFWERKQDQSPQFGVGRRGSPQFVPICSVFFRFAFRTAQIWTNKGNPFLPTPNWQIPEKQRRKNTWTSFSRDCPGSSGHSVYMFFYPIRISPPPQKKNLRAKGALISEPRFSTPCEMWFFPREKGKTAVSKKNPLDKGRFTFLGWAKSHLAGGRKSGLTN